MEVLSTSSQGALGRPMVSLYRPPVIPTGRHHASLYTFLSYAEFPVYCAVVFLTAVKLIGSPMSSRLIATLKRRSQHPPALTADLEVSFHQVLTFRVSESMIYIAVTPRVIRAGHP